MFFNKKKAPTASHEDVRSMREKIDKQNQKIRWLQRKLDQEYAKKKEAEEIKDAVLSVLSHELRTPLTSIKAAINLLMSDQELYDNLNANKKLLFNIAHEQTDHMTSMVERLLCLKKLRYDHLYLSYEQVNIIDFIQKIIFEREKKASKKKVKLTFLNPPANWMADISKEYLTLAFDTLLSNAIKVSPKDTEIQVKLEFLEEQEKYRLSIQDQGPGIPDSWRKKIFEDFTQIDMTASRSLSGLGIGLSLCHSLVKLMDGKIHFVDNLKKGTTFIIDIPKEQINISNNTEALDMNERKQKAL